MVRRLVVMTIFAVSVGMAWPLAQGRQGGPPAGPPQLRSGETYLWHGEMVAFEPGARTLTVKTRLLPQAAADVERLAVNDRVLLTWSGQDIHAGAVRRVTKYDPAQRIVEFFALPADLVSKDVTGGLVTVRVRVPEAAAGAVKGLKPTEWVTIMARQRPANDGEVIASVSRYIKSQN